MSDYKLTKEEAEQLRSNNLIDFIISKNLATEYVEFIRENRV